MDSRNLAKGELQGAGGSSEPEVSRQGGERGWAGGGGCVALLMEVPSGGIHLHCVKKKREKLERR